MFIWLICLLSIIGAAIFLNLNRFITPVVRFPGLYDEYLISFVYGTVGLLILLFRPRHAIGWIFLFIGFVGSLSSLAQGHAIYSLITSANELPGGRLAGWFQAWASGTVILMPTILLMMVFPDGHLPSRRWLPLAILTILTIGLTIFAALTEAGDVFVWIADSSPTRLPMTNPTGTTRLPIIQEIAELSWFVGLLLVAGAIFAPISRFRGARGIQRQQLKWFVYFGAFTLLLFALVLLDSFTIKLIDADYVGEFVLALILLILPLATTVAILRHGLYDIDVIIKRTLIYFVLTLILIGIYLSSVIFLQYVFSFVAGQESPVAIVISTLIIAALFNPLRHRVQDIIDRRFYRNKYNAEQTLSHFGQKARDEVDLDQLSAELMRVVQETMQPEQATLWLKPASGSRRKTTK